jgi:intracellular multiplication protein IcmL
MSHKLAAFIAFILLGSQVGLLSVIYIQYAMRPHSQYYGALPSQQNFPIVALNRPNVSPKALTSWATLAATATYTIDFVHADENLNKIKDYFTLNGYENYRTALDETQFIQNIISKKLVTSAVSVAPAMITQEGEGLDGNYTWQILVPMLVSYLSSSSDVKEFRVVSLTVVQVPTHDAPKGIGISRYVTRSISESDIAG